ncbi:MAG: insulinase family protein [Oscillospiraceae bacterium]|nr:insulinase family protein [Oscillospiraceae bacterium]
MNRQKIGDEIYFTAIVDKKFKTNRISVNFIVQLNADNVAARAMLPFILRRSTSEISDFTELSKNLSTLYGAILDGDIRKIGDSQIINLSVSGLDNTFALEGENITGELAHILVTAVIRPDGKFNAGSDIDAFKTEQRNLIDLIEGEINDKRSYAINRLIEIMCENEPYGISKYGKAEQAGALTPEQVNDAYLKLLESAGIEIIYVGCSGADIALEKFKEAFSGVKRRSVPKTSVTVIKEAANEKSETEQKGVVQAKMAMGFRTGIGAADKQSAPARLMTSIYGGTPFSLLFLNVRERLSLCYYCAARFDRAKGILTVDCGVEEDNIQKAKDEILAQLKALQGGEFSDDELKHAAMSAVNSLKTVGDSPAGLELWYLGQICYGLDSTPEEEAKVLSAVTREEVLSAAASVSLDTVYVLKGDGEPENIVKVNNQ